MLARWRLAAVIVDVVEAGWADAIDGFDVGREHEMVDVARRPNAPKGEGEGVGLGGPVGRVEGVVVYWKGSAGSSALVVSILVFIVKGVAQQLRP